jgi:DNA-binding transcriptional MerR regulator
VRTHTIGEVLNRLKDEFDDITISKIRFLEAEGLISPDRTESGYRKFTPGDVDRLRYVLRAQRDRYLPLKVIKDELSRIDAGLPVEAPPAQPDPGEVAVLRGEEADGLAEGAPMAPGAAGPAAADSQEEVVPPLLGAAPSDVQLSASELADATGLTDREIGQLRDHGLLPGGPRYDGDDLRVAKLAADLLEWGLEPRHLRMYRQFADREQALYEQLVAPLLRQRNPDSRQAAVEQIEELGATGGRLHRALLARELRAQLHP